MKVPMQFSRSCSCAPEGAQAAKPEHRSVNNSCHFIARTHGISVSFFVFMMVVSNFCRTFAPINNYNRRRNGKSTTRANMRDVFISYSRHDLEAVKAIKQEIENAIEGRCWMDLEGIESGMPRFTKAIIDGINDCSVFLFMRSEASQTSKFALRELNFAEEKGKRVVIVHIDDSTMADEFQFLYGLSDSISWTNLPQREKLFRDLKRWLATAGDRQGTYVTQSIGKLTIRTPLSGEWHVKDFFDYPLGIIVTDNPLLLTPDDARSIIGKLSWAYAEEDLKDYYHWFFSWPDFTFQGVKLRNSRLVFHRSTNKISTCSYLFETIGKASESQIIQMAELFIQELRDRGYDESEGKLYDNFLLSKYFTDAKGFRYKIYVIRKEEKDAYHLNLDITYDE